MYNVLSENEIKDNISKGAIALVKRASNHTKDHLPDDTTAVVLEVLNADEIEILKQQKLDIPRSLKAGQTIDGYKLEKPLIQNERTWLAEKNKAIRH
ncbi:hypothetical protein [Sulfurimonas sp. NW9]|uniref:hypothetical protein n=1 Tax=Sulfurimonas sp. NW9 TaxID=2922728 RepID=UPI003DA97C0F